MSDNKKLWEHEIDGVEDTDDIKLEDNDHELDLDGKVVEEVVEEVAEESVENDENLGGRRIGGHWHRL